MLIELKFLFYFINLIILKTNKIKLEKNKFKNVEKA